MDDAIETLLRQAEWVRHGELIGQATPRNAPCITHEAWVTIGAVRVHAYLMNTGLRVIEAESVERLVRWLAEREE